MLRSNSKSSFINTHIHTSTVASLRYTGPTGHSLFRGRYTIRDAIVTCAQQPT